MGLKALIKLKKQEGIKRFRGKLEWSGDLDDMRRLRDPFEKALLAESLRAQSN